jgi:hypothetical protein
MGEPVAFDGPTVEQQRALGGLVERHPDPPRATG